MPEPTPTTHTIYGTYSELSGKIHTVLYNRISGRGENWRASEVIEQILKVLGIEKIEKATEIPE